MGRKRLTQVTETTINNGAPVTTSKSYHIQTDSDAFFMTFLENLSGLFQIKNATDFKVITKLNTLAEFNTGRVILTKEMRIDMLEELKLDNQVLSNSIKRLKSAELLAGDRGVYEINPLVFWKGTTEDRKKLLREKGIEIKIKFSSSEENAEPAYNPMVSGSKEFK